VLYAAMRRKKSPLVNVLFVTTKDLHRRAAADVPDPLVK
jgi:hypothetical protein